MFHRDYIMRMVHELARAVKKILKLRELQQFEEAQVEIDKTAKMLLGLDMNLIRGLSDEQVLSLFRSMDSLDSGKSIVIAELFKEEGQIHELRNRPDEIYQSYVKSLSIFAEALTVDEELRSVDYISKIDSLIEKLSRYELPPPHASQALPLLRSDWAICEIRGHPLSITGSRPDGRGRRRYRLL